MLGRRQCPERSHGHGEPGRPDLPCRLSRGDRFRWILAKLVRNNIYVYGIRGEGKSATHRAAALMAQKRFDAKLMHTHTFPLEEVPTAFRYFRERIEDAIKVVVKV